MVCLRVVADSSLHDGASFSKISSTGKILSLSEMEQKNGPFENTEISASSPGPSHPSHRSVRSDSEVPSSALAPHCWICSALIFSQRKKDPLFENGYLVSSNRFVPRLRSSERRSKFRGAVSTD